MSGRHDMARLLSLMRRLRDPQGGCPWDCAQTMESLAPGTLEEAYEVVDAAEGGDADALCEELGDLLLQVVFYCQLAAEQGSFDMDEVVHRLVAKLVRRHPHLFPDGDIDAPAGRVAQHPDWEQLKQRERQGRGQGRLFDDIPAALPAMARAEKLQRRAAKIGLDWPDAAGAEQAVRAELRELAEAPQERRGAELGDLLFSCINLARHLGLDPEQALRCANRRFAARAGYVAERTGGADAPVGAAELQRLWDAAKAACAG